MRTFDTSTKLLMLMAEKITMKTISGEMRAIIPQIVVLLKQSQLLNLNELLQMKQKNRNLGRK